MNLVDSDRDTTDRLKPGHQHARAVGVPPLGGGVRLRMSLNPPDCRRVFVLIADWSQARDHARTARHAIGSQIRATIGWLARLRVLSIVLCTLLACLPAAQLPAHDQIPGKPQTKPIVIKNATVYPIDRPPIDGGRVLLEEGKITAVGKAVKVPDKAVEIDAAGKHVYPGLIESVSEIGLIEISAVSATDDRIEHGRRNPNARAWVAVNPDSEQIPVARAGGVLTAMVAPMGSWLRGQTAVLNLDGWTAAEMALRAPAGLYVDWTAVHSRGDDRHQEREDALANLDALLDEVRRYSDAIRMRPEATPTDVRLESLVPVINGDLPIFVDASRQAEIESAVAYAQSQGLQLVIHGGHDAEGCSQLLKRYNIPVIIGSTLRQPLRRDEPYDAAFTLPARLHRAGVHFAIAAEGPGSRGGASHLRNLSQHAAAAVAYGLSHELALRSITLSAAEILGVADRLGSLTPGKDATMIVTDGDILEMSTRVTDAYIQGRKVDLGSRHKMLFEKYQQKYSRR